MRSVAVGIERRVGGQQQRIGSEDQNESNQQKAGAGVLDVAYNMCYIAPCVGAGD
jgi:hypothetical protein